MAGAFAKKIGAKALVLNHIGGRSVLSSLLSTKHYIFSKPLQQNKNKTRFPAPRNPRDFARQKVIFDIERNANRAWGSGKQCTAAYDYLRVEVPRLDKEAVAGSSSSGVE